MGLLDQFSGMSDEQTQGLLAAAAQMLQQSGPSLRPTGIGQILGGGMSAYQDSTAAARKRKLEEDAAKQSGLLRGLQIQEAQGGLQDHARARQDADRLRDFFTKRQLAQSPAAAPGEAASPQLASAMPGGPMSPKLGGPDWMQDFQASQPAPAARAPQAKTGEVGPYEQRMALADDLRAQGFHVQADAQEAAALKFKPKFANEPRTVRGPDGKPMLVQMADDGTVRPIEGGYGVAEKLNFQSIGGKTLGLDPYSGAASASFAHTQTPDSLASNALTRRGQDMTDARAREFNDTRVEENKQKALTGKAPTEFQGKSAAFGLRATEADKILNELNGKYSPEAINSKNTVENTWLVGGALGAATNKFALSGTDQRAEQAQRDFVNAVLRQESGAAIGAQEFDNAKKQYFPQPGDGPDVIQQKATNRQLAIQGFNNNAGRAAMVAPPKPAAGQWSIKRKD